MVEQGTENPCVGGSIPPLATIIPEASVIPAQAGIQFNYELVESKHRMCSPFVELYARLLCKRVRTFVLWVINIALGILMPIEFVARGTEGQTVGVGLTLDTLGIPLALARVLDHRIYQQVGL